MPSSIYSLLYGQDSLNAQLFLLINGAHHHLLDPMMRAVTILGSPRWAVVYVALFAVVSLAMRKKMPLSTVLIFGVASLIGLLLERGLKELLHVPRPAAALGLDQVRVLGPVLLKNAFPSGHATFVAVLASSVGGHRDWRWKVLLWSFVALVCWSRIYVGAHYPLDVVAGVLVGMFAGISVRLMWERFGPKQGKRGR